MGLFFEFYFDTLVCWWNGIPLTDTIHFIPPSIPSRVSLSSPHRSFRPAAPVFIHPVLRERPWEHRNLVPLPAALRYGPSVVSLKQESEEEVTKSYEIPQTLSSL